MQAGKARSYKQQIFRSSVLLQKWVEAAEGEGAEAHSRPHRQVCPSLVKPGNDKPALHARWLHRTVLGNPAADSDHATVGEFYGG